MGLRTPKIKSRSQTARHIKVSSGGRSRLARSFNSRLHPRGPNGRFVKK